MSTNLGKSGKGRIRSLVRKGAEARKRARGAGSGPAPEERTVCGRCGADYQRRTWRRGRLAGESPSRRARAVCPACSQVRREEALGSVTARGRFVGAHGLEIRRRIENVCRRAAGTQPERRIVSLRLEGDELELRTTSQKLSHRVAAELSKAFGGSVSYDWIDRDGTLRAVWRPRARAS